MIVSKYILPSCLVLSLSLNASEDVLSPTKQALLDYSYQKSIEDSSKLKNDWINPITYRYSYNHGELYDTQKSMISISQPIFKSGGIYYAIKYANSMERYSKTSIDNQKKELIKQTVNLLFQIKNIGININKQKLLIQNSKLDIERKKEQVLNGILDTSFLDNSILDSNIKQNGLIDLELQKFNLINNLSNFSDKEYSQFKLPVLDLVENKKFLENNIYIKNSKEDIDNSYWLKNMITSNYLPTVNFTADHTKYHETDNNPQLKDGTNIGFNITIPLDIKFSNTIESSKIEYLKKKTTLEDKRIEESSIYNSAIETIKSLDKKIVIAKNDLELYDSLLTQIKEQHSVGMKTDSDVQTMINSKEVKTLDIQKLNVDKQIELLEIYSRVNHEQ